MVAPLPFLKVVVVSSSTVTYSVKSIVDSILLSALLQTTASFTERVGGVLFSVIKATSVVLHPVAVAVTVNV